MRNWSAGMKLGRKLRKIRVRELTKEKWRPSEKKQENAGNTVEKWGGKVY